jgi:hypothetical protein
LVLESIRDAEVIPAGLQKENEHLLSSLRTLDFQLVLVGIWMQVVA